MKSSLIITITDHHQHHHSSSLNITHHHSSSLITITQQKSSESKFIMCTHIYNYIHVHINVVKTITITQNTIYKWVVYTIKHGMVYSCFNHISTFSASEAAEARLPASAHLGPFAAACRRRIVSWPLWSLRECPRYPSQIMNVYTFTRCHQTWQVGKSTK